MFLKLGLFPDLGKVPLRNIPNFHEIEPWSINNPGIREKCLFLGTLKNEWAGLGTKFSKYLVNTISGGCKLGSFSYLGVKGQWKCKLDFEDSDSF